MHTKKNVVNRVAVRYGFKDPCKIVKSDGLVWSNKNGSSSMGGLGSELGDERRALPPGAACSVIVEDEDDDDNAVDRMGSGRGVRGTTVCVEVVESEEEEVDEAGEADREGDSIAGEALGGGR